MKKALQTLFWIWVSNMFYLKLFADFNNPSGVDLIATGVFLIGTMMAITVGVWRITGFVFDL